jgi:hypothetical protein
VYDAARRLYSVEVSFTGAPIGPGLGSFSKEAQVRIGLRSGPPASAWDPMNDWLYQGLLPGENSLVVTPHIPVYEFGTQKLSGRTPP